MRALLRRRRRGDWHVPVLCEERFRGHQTPLVSVIARSDTGFAFLDVGASSVAGLLAPNSLFRPRDEVLSCLYTGNRSVCVFCAVPRPGLGPNLATMPARGRSGWAFRPQIRVRSFVALKVPHMTH